MHYNSQHSEHQGAFLTSALGPGPPSKFSSLRRAFFETILKDPAVQSQAAAELSPIGLRGGLCYGSLLWTLAGPWRQQAEELTQLQKRTVTATGNCIRPRPAAPSVVLQVSKSARQLECANAGAPAFRPAQARTLLQRVGLLTGATAFLKLADWQAAARAVG